MADHIDDNAETSENRSLDQSAIDEAIAAMQAEASEDDEVAAEEDSNPASAGSETVDQNDIDDAIAAVQADADE